MVDIDWSSVAQDSMVYIIGALVLSIIGYLKRKKLSLIVKKIVFNLQPRKFQIVFAIEFRDGLNSGIYYEQIKKNFLKQIDNNGLSKQIKMLDVSDIYLFKTKDEAERFRELHDLDLIVLGDFSNDWLKMDKKSVNKLDLNFTFRIPQSLDQLKLFIAKDLQSKFAQKTYWKIYKNNSLQDIEIISTNLFDIATY